MNEKPIILFESYPDFSGSPLEIYNELIRRGYDKKYDMVWAVYSTFNEKTNYKIVKFFGCNTQEKQNVLARTKIIIDSNRYIQKPNASVFRLHTRHGCNLKRCDIYSHGIGNVDALLSTSEEMKQSNADVYSKEMVAKTIVTGYPVNDKLFHGTNIYKSSFFKNEFSNKRFAKIIGWFPTYRQHRGGNLGTSIPVLKYGLPIMNSLEDFERLNDFLKDKNILLLVQRHHAQAKNYLNTPSYSNIFFINEDIQTKYGIELTTLLTNIDALITDYSSIYYEFLLLNKPIALCVEDLIPFNKAFGFVFNYLKWIKGDYLLTISDLIDFCRNVYEGIDTQKDEREKLCRKVHRYVDDKSTKRVVDYLVQYL